MAQLTVVNGHITPMNQVLYHYKPTKVGPYLWLDGYIRHRAVFFFNYRPISRASPLGC